MRIRTTSLASLGLLASLMSVLVVQPGQAGIVVNWGGNYVSSSQHYAGHVPANASGSNHYGDPDGPYAMGADSVAGRAYRSSAFSPSSGYGGTSATFYGGGSVTRSNSLVNDGFSDLEVLDQGANDSLHFRINTGGDAHTFHLLTFWDKSDFLFGASSQPNLTLDPNGQFTLRTSQSAGNHPDLLLRWVVRDGSQFYVSQANFGLSNNSTFSSLNPSLINWSAYNPVLVGGVPTAGDLMSLDFNESGTYSPVSFTDITGLGFYIEHESPNGPVHSHIEGFSVSAVPEPSSLMSCLVLGIAGLALRRFRVNGKTV